MTPPRLPIGLLLLPLAALPAAGPPIPAEVAAPTEKPAVDPAAGARDSLDELQALITEVRALCVPADEETPGGRWFGLGAERRPPPPPAPPPAVDADALAALESAVAERRAALDRLEERLAAPANAEAVYREAGVVFRWAADRATPLTEEVRRRRRADLERLRRQAEESWQGLALLDFGNDPLLGLAGQRRAQARAAWSEGDEVAARAHYEGLLRLSQAAAARAGQLDEARIAADRAEGLRDYAAARKAERLAEPLWRAAEELRGQALAAAAAHRPAEATHAWRQAAVVFEQAGGTGEREYRLERARLGYEDMVAGLADDDLEALGPMRQDMDSFAAYAQDERNDPEVRAERYRALVRNFAAPVASLRLRKARALLEQGDAVAALDTLAPALRQQPADPEARRLFNAAAAAHADWWLAQAKDESADVTDDLQRLVLYELLARSRRVVNDRAGADRAVAASVALVRAELRAGRALPPLDDLTRFCLESNDRDGTLAILGVVEEAVRAKPDKDAALKKAAARGAKGARDARDAPPEQPEVREMPDHEKARWLAWMAGTAERNGDVQAAGRWLQEALDFDRKREAYLRIDAALAAGRPETALMYWRRFAWVGRAAPADVAPAEAADYGLRILEAAAESSAPAAYRDLRVSVLRWAERIADEGARAAVLRRAALADALFDDWDAFLVLLGDGSDAGLLETAARIDGRRGDALSARRALDMAGTAAPRTAWYVARAQAAQRDADPAELLDWVRDLPDPAARCAAYLGVAAGLGGRR